MNSKTLTAFTPVKYEGSYPPYFNVSLHNAEVVITVRGPVKDGRCGETVSMTMPVHEFGLCLAEIDAELKGTK